MQNASGLVFVEVNRNSLRILTPSLEKKDIQVSREVVNDSKIISVDDLSKTLKEGLKELKSKASRVIFLIEEKDIFDRFFVVRNDEVDIETNLHHQAATYVGRPLDNLACVFQKVSPFVYQFVGVDKEILAAYSTLASKAGLKLEGLIPISFIFSKFIGSFDPFFFIFKGVDEATLIASEYGGVYYSGTYSTTSEINRKVSSLISELSSFNRESPVKDVYYLGDEVKIDGSFNLKSVHVPEDYAFEGMVGFERLALAIAVTSKDPEFLDSYFNLKTFLNAKSSKKGSSSMPKLAVPAVVLLSIALGAFLIYSSKNANKPANNDANNVKESTSSATVPEAPKESTKSAQPLNKASLKIRVENGSGTAGVAGKARDFLTPKGYTISEVGNAASADYAETNIQIKDSKKEYLNVLLDDLKSNYTTKVGNPLAESTSYDVLIIVGKK